MKNLHRRLRKCYLTEQMLQSNHNNEEPTPSLEELLFNRDDGAVDEQPNEEPVQQSDEHNRTYDTGDLLITSPNSMAPLFTIPSSHLDVCQPLLDNYLKAAEELKHFELFNARVTSVPEIKNVGEKLHNNVAASRGKLVWKLGELLFGNEKLMGVIFK